jgi:hypothetical protein
VVFLLLGNGILNMEAIALINACIGSLLLFRRVNPGGVNGLVLHIFVFFSRRLKTYFIIYYDTHTGTRKKEGESAFGER